MKHLMKLAQALILSLCCEVSLASDAVFDEYKRLLTKLDDTQEIQSFIDKNNYLSDRLRKKWLSYLAKNKSYELFLQNYIPSKSIARRCQYLTALYHTGKTDSALQQVEPIWLSGESLPESCDNLLSVWRTSNYFSNDLLWRRFNLAIENKSYGLAKHLASDMAQDDQELAKKWILISKAPHKIRSIHLHPHEKNTAMLTHGIRKLIKGNINNAIKNWQHMKKSHQFTHEQTQHILRTIALYSAMRNRQDAIKWFNKLDSTLMSTMHHEWRVRAALKQTDWLNVKKAIEALPQELKDNPCWQYWHARALSKLGESKKALNIYENLSKKRHYYGFLASFQAQLKPSMQHEKETNSVSVLNNYKDEINHIKTLYQEKKTHKANLLSYELANNLNDLELIELAQIYEQWGWHEKALSVANTSKHKDHLHLRFPLAHKSLVIKNAKQYKVSPSLVFAVIRQESTFRKNAKSTANAMGLMQVIPSTAKKVAKGNEIKLTKINDMYQPKINVQVGTAYLNELSKRFHNHPILMAAAYNAGPRQVQYWLKKHPKNDPDIWIETLPWGETRNYLKNILSFYAVYQYRLDKEPNIKPFMAPL